MLSSGSKFFIPDLKKLEIYVLKYYKCMFLIYFIIFKSFIIMRLSFLEKYIISELNKYNYLNNINFILVFFS